MTQVQKSELQCKLYVTKWGIRNNPAGGTAEDDYFMFIAHTIIINLLHISVCHINNHTKYLQLIIRITAPVHVHY